jgi:hypothetical protein
LKFLIPPPTKNGLFDLIFFSSCLGDILTKLRMTSFQNRGRTGYDRLVVGFTTTYAIGAYHHWVWISLRARCATLCDKFCQWLAAGRWFPPCTPVSSTDKTDCHDIAEILLKVALSTIKPTNHFKT